LDRRELGRLGEDAVARHLEARGFAVFDRNVRLRRGELDLVAERAGVWWFVECKCRSRSDVGTPLRAVDARKRAALFAAAREFVVRRRFRGDWGFLAASILWEPGAPHPVVAVERLAIGPAALDRHGGWRARRRD
jgi:putative endonuclease